MAYSPEVVSLLQQLRSRIFAEFGLKIRLVDPALLGLVGELGKKSRDPFTRRTVVKIMSLAAVPYDIDDTEQRRQALRKQAAEMAAAEASAVPSLGELTYRGNKVARSSSPVNPAPQRENKKVTRQIYRGQVVYK